MRRVLIIAALCLLVALPARAQDFVSLENWIALPEDRKDTSYIYVRCTGLYAALTGEFGSGYSDEEAESVSNIILDLSTVAAVLRSQKLGISTSDTMLLTKVMEDVQGVSELYQERMDTNYRATGELLGSDQLLLSDMAVCREMAGVAKAVLDRTQE